MAEAASHQHRLARSDIRLTNSYADFFLGENCKATIFFDSKEFEEITANVLE
jgi:hypothetical protein